MQSRNATDTIDPSPPSVSKREAQLQEQIRAREMVTFTVDDIRRFLGVSRNNAYRIINNMLRKHLAKRLQRGVYILKEMWDSLDSYELAANIVDASYIGFWSALHFHSMTDQTPRKIFIATTIRKRPMKVHSETLRFVTVKPELFFGYERQGLVTVSTPEKTIVDSLHLPQYAGGVMHIARAIHSGLDIATMVENASQMNIGAVSARLGYLLERKGLLGDGRGLQRSVRSYTVLDPGADRTARELNERWKVYVNVDLSDREGESEC